MPNVPGNTRAAYAKQETIKMSQEMGSRDARLSWRATHKVKM